MHDEKTLKLAVPDSGSDGREEAPSPDPAREALEEPPLSAEELEREIGDSDPWDEASEPAS